MTFRCWCWQTLWQLNKRRLLPTLGIRLAREKQVNVRVIPTSHAIEESVELAHEIFNRVFRKVSERMERRG